MHMEKNKKAYIITDSELEVGEMVWITYINTREDLEALSREDLVRLAWHLINNFIRNRF